MAELNLGKNKFIGALVLNRIFPEKMRKFLEMFVVAAATTLSLLFLYSLLLQNLSENLVKPFSLPVISEISPSSWMGFVLILLALWLFLIPLDFYVNSRTSGKNGKRESSDLAQRLNLYGSELFSKDYLSLSSQLKI